MTDQYTPTTRTVRYWYIYARRASAEFNHEQVPDTSEAWAEFDRWLAARDASIEAAAEQRGAVKALRDAAESKSLIDYMYTNLHANQPVAVREAAKYLHNRADLLEGDDETH